MIAGCLCGLLILIPDICSLRGMRWDDSATDARILRLKQTQAPSPPVAPNRNIAPFVRTNASNQPVPSQDSIKASNDGFVRTNPSLPDMWAT